jgi:serine/threonine-protein phosphatase 5
VEFYTKAIDLDPGQALFYSNRAHVWIRPPERICVFVCSRGLHPQAHIKLEAYGLAIADATKAIELDPGYVKVCPWM